MVINTFMDITTRSEAMILGLDRYYTGEPCKHGHLVQKLTVNGTCVECLRQKKATPQQKERANSARRKARAADPEPIRQADRLKRKANLALFRERDKKRWENGKADKQSAWLKEDRKKRPWIYTERARARKRKVRQATPPWLTKDQRDEIIAVYKKAAELSLDGLLHHVDHIVPLTGDNVCGLHVPWNLQAIPAHENMSKGNKF